jgi:hypothetical protein
VSTADDAQMHMAVLDGLKTAMASTQAAYTKTVTDIAAATPEAVPVGAVPRRGVIKKIPAPHVGMASAAKRSLDTALDYVTRAHAEIQGHLNFAAEADKKFQTYKAEQASKTSPAPVGTPVPTPEQVAAWAAANGYVKKPNE